MALRELRSHFVQFHNRIFPLLSSTAPLTSTQKKNLSTEKENNTQTKQWTLSPALIYSASSKQLLSHKYLKYYTKVNNC